MKVTKESETPLGYCQCGRPLHYSKQSIKQQVDRMIELAGEQFVTVKVAGKGEYRVQRHFIALHGLHAEKIDDYGFEKVLTQNSVPQ